MARKLDIFPAFHKVAGQPVLIVGNLAEAVAKVRLLRETSADIRVHADDPSPELSALAREARIDLIADDPTDAQLLAATLVFAATGDRDRDANLVARARRLNRPVNAVDRPDLCDFYTPALVNRAPVAVAISSTGAGPVLAQRLRARLETLLPLRLGDVAMLASEYRSSVERMLPAGAPRRRFWRRFFSGSVADDALAGNAAEARIGATKLLGQDHGEPGRVFLVGAGPGAEDLLTLRAQRVLQEADVIVYDRLVPGEIVAMGRRDADRIYVGKAKGRHAKSQDQINAILVKQARGGKRIVRLKSGDPLIFGRAGEEMAALRAAGIPFEVVPGVTSAFAAAAAAQIPLTLRGVASSLVFATGHDAAGKVLPGWSELALSGNTIAVYMGRSVAAQVAARLVEAGLGPATPVAVVESASQPGQRIFAGSVSELAAFAGRDDIDGPALILIGQAIAAASLEAAEPLTELGRLAA